MKRKCIITIKGSQSNHGDDFSDINMVTEGNFFTEDGVYFCDYEESELTGLQGTDTSIEIGKDYVSLIRCGAVNSQLLFMEGRKTSSLYSMPFGELMIDVYTKKLNIDINDSGGKILVDYSIDINNSAAGINNFEISIREEN